MAKDIASKRDECLFIEEELILVQTLYKGTKAMREQGALYLPRREVEPEVDWQKRIDKATLFPAFQETVDSYTGRVFAKGLMPNDDMPDWLVEEVFPNVDMRGRNLQSFASDVFRESLIAGAVMVFVDAPAAPQNENGSPLTVQQQNALNLRPYAYTVPYKDLLGWKSKDGYLTQLRVRMHKEVEDGPYHTKRVEKIYVHEPGKLTIHGKTTQGEWIEEDERLTGLDRIPMQFFTTNRTGYLQASPPLHELAYLNVKHWQQLSMRDNLLDVVSVPILVSTGADLKNVVVGGGYMLNIPEDATLKYVEHTGAAIKTGSEALKDLEHEMTVAGAALMRRDNATHTRAQVKEEAARGNSTLGGMVTDFTSSMEGLAALLASTRGEEGGTFTLDANLDAEDFGESSMNQLEKLYIHRIISKRTFFAEAQRRGELDEAIEWEIEQTRVAEEPL